MMRPELEAVIREAKRQRTHGIEPELPSAQPGTAANDDSVPDMETPETQDREFQRTLYQEAVVRCLETHPAIHSARVTTLAGIDVAWKSSDQHIVVEISRYGSLAAVYPYGSPPEDSHCHLSLCTYLAMAIRRFQRSEETLFELQAG